MKIRYSFTADVKDVHNILLDKIKRYTNKYTVKDMLTNLEASLRQEKNLEAVKVNAEECLIACHDLLNELSEIVEFIESYQNSLQDKNETTQQKSPEYDLPVSTQENSKEQAMTEIQNSMMQLSNLTESLKSIKEDKKD